MRIITGKLKGRRFEIPKGLDVRPTTDRTKESMFNKIEAYTFIQGSRVLDLFAGSGNLGFEAISRGAQSVLAVDVDSANLKLIEKIARNWGIDHQIQTVCSDVQRFLEHPSQAYNYIFCDPPYHYEWMDQMIEQILEKGWLSDKGWFLLEHDKYHNYKDHKHCFFSKAYGRTTVSIFQAQPVDSEL